MLAVMSKHAENAFGPKPYFYILYIFYILNSCKVKKSLKSECVLIIGRAEHLNSVLYAFIR